MSNWMLLLYLVGAALMLWMIVRMIRGNPQAFSKENLSKSFFTLGVLTLFILGIIFLCIVFLKST